MPSAHNKPTNNLYPRVWELLLHLGFAATGVGTVLLGSILPRLAMQWHLRDRDAGIFLFVQFAASASGSLLVRRNLKKTMALGYGLFAAGGLAIYLVQQHSLPAFAVLGLGMGMAMTSTNVMVGRRTTGRRGAALAVLNFAWSAGAVTCPLLAAHLLQRVQATTLFGLLGLAVVPFALLPVISRRGAFPAVIPASRSPVERQEVRTIAYFAALAFLYVGVESSVSNWMSSYATRKMMVSFAGSSQAIALFWAALLLGRALTPAMLRLTSELRLYQTSIVAAIAGICVLLAAHDQRVLLSGSILTGLMLGPVFPLNLSLYLEKIGESQNVGWVFAVSGLGGALCSWLIGFVSSGSGSLRIGLTVPAVAAMIMAAMAIFRRPMENSHP